MTTSAVSWWRPVFWVAILVGTLVEAAKVVIPTTLVWPTAKSCVAWAAEAKVFWFKTEHPIGMNCFVSARINENTGYRTVHLEVPIWKFDSGEPKRDADVVRMLGGDKQPKIIFDSDDMDAGQWQTMLGNPRGMLNGKIFVNGNSYAITFDITVYGKDKDAVLDGIASARLNGFGIKPPKIGGGLIADVKDEMTLHVHLRAQDVAGM